MATKKKNSNYMTDKTIAAKNAKAEEKRKKKIKKNIFFISTAVVAAALIVGIIFAIGVPLGMLDYKPEATSHVAIEFEGYEDVIHIELYGNDAPEAVEHFLHSLTDLEGSSITALKGTLAYFGAAGHTHGDESEKDAPNDISFRRGIIALASDDYKPGGAPYFIVTDKATELNGEYVAFAKITSGIKVIESILEDATIEGDTVEGAPKIISATTHDAHSH